MDTEFPTDQPTEEPGKPPVIASYLVRVTVRGDTNAHVPSNAEIGAAIQREVASLVVGPGMTSVTTSAERLDK